MKLSKQLEQNVIKISAFRAPFFKSEIMVIRLIVQYKQFIILIILLFVGASRKSFIIHLTMLPELLSSRTSFTHKDEFLDTADS